MLKLSHIPNIAAAVLLANIGRKTPLKVTQYVTYRCNLKCAFCGRRLIDAQEMTMDQIKGCMEEFRRMGTLYWGINGGEPLVRPDIGEIISLARHQGFKVSVSTNGLLVPQKIDALKNVDLVLVSIDGPENVHDSVRGEGTYRRVIKAIEALRGLGINVFIVTVLNKNNLDCLESVLRVAEKYGCHNEFQPITLHRSDIEGNAKEFFPLHDDLVVTIDWLIKQKKAGRPVTNSINYLEQMKTYPDPMDIDCRTSRFVCVISPQGIVLPCSEMLTYQPNGQSGLLSGFDQAYRSLPDMLKCRECFFSCYAEYNCALRAPFKSLFRMIGNIPKGKWFWQ